MFWKLLSENPFLLLKEHMHKSMICINQSQALFESLFQGNKERVNSLAKELGLIEYECDIIKRKIRTQLTQAFFLPVDRRDILNVLSNMDNIADFSEDLGVLVTLRWMELPPQLHAPFWDLMNQVIHTVKEASWVIDSLDRLLETGFTGPDAEEVLIRIDQVEKAEHLADKAQDRFGKALFTYEDEMKPAALYMWIKIANKIGDLANAAERMVGHIRLMLSNS